MTATAVSVKPASLLLEGVSVERAGRVVLANVSLRARGGVIAVLGPNGSGKTTLLRALATVTSQAAGLIRVDGLDPTDPSQRLQVRSFLGYGPQAMRFHPRTKVFDAVDYVATLRLDLPTAPRQRETWRVIDVLDLGRLAGNRLSSLSEGNRQRVTIAQGLLGPPRFAVFDEPLVSLDPEIRLRCQNALGDLGRRCTIVMASHLVNEAASFADQVIVLGQGQPAFVGTPAQLIAEGGGQTATHGYLAVRGAGH